MKTLGYIALFIAGVYAAFGVQNTEVAANDSVLTATLASMSENNVFSSATCSDSADYIEYLENADDTVDFAGCGGLL